MKHCLAIGFAIAAVIASATIVSAQEAAVSAPSSTDEIACQSGVYLVDVSNDSKTLRPIAENFTDHRKLGNALGGILFAGISSMKIEAVVLGNRANVRTNTTKPQFKFCFPAEAPRSEIGASAGSAYVGTSRTALSPKEYSLVRFESDADSRSLSIGKIKTAGVVGAIPDSSVRFSVTQDGPGVYYVTPDQPLTPGEYGFFHAAPAAMASMKKGKGKVRERVFDFGID